MVEGHFAVCLDGAARDEAVLDGAVLDSGWSKLVQTVLVKLFEHLALGLSDVDFV